MLAAFFRTDAPLRSAGLLLPQEAARACVWVGVRAHVCMHTCASTGAVVAGEVGQEAAEGVSPWDEPQWPWDPRVLNMLGKASPPFPEHSGVGSEQAQNGLASLLAVRGC